MIRKILAVSFVLCVSVNIAVAQNCAVYPNVLANGQNADANQVMANFNHVRDCVNNGIGGGRPVLTANRTYYVRTDGSDSNDGLTNSAAGAFLTIQKAVDVSSSLDLSIYDVTIQVGNGTYATPIVLKTLVGAGKVTIRGDTTTPANVVISTTSASAISASTIVGRYKVEGIKIQTTTSGFAIYLVKSGLEIGSVDFGTSASNHLMLEAQSYLLVSASYTISGGASVHWAVRSGSYLDCRSLTITITGAPTIGIFAYADLLATMLVASNTFSGSASGQRYNISGNSVLFTAAGATYLPGNSSGVATTGAQYF